MIFCGTDRSFRRIASLHMGGYQLVFYFGLGESGFHLVLAFII